MTTCNSCGADIVWLKTPHGKNTPIDALPVAGGNITIVGGVAQVVPASYPGVRYKAHGATCPNAAQHRSARP